MNRSGHADLPLHYGRVPPWLAQRMSRLGGAMIEAIIEEYGRDEVLTRLSDPLWFQSFGAVLGMDWHSSGITTSVMGALKRAIAPRSAALGLYVCGGRGRHSLATPDELRRVAERTGLDGEALVRSSRLSARVDNNAVQDGFQIYLHSFVVTAEGNWAVIQQGMNTGARLARRYHWHSPSVRSFVEEPHTAVVGEPQGRILNLTDREAASARAGVLDVATRAPDRMLPEIRKIVMPAHHQVEARDVDLERLGAVLALAHSQGCPDFESLLLTPGLGPRTLFSLALVSEVLHGTPGRFTDPARFSFAHGGKDRHPIPVPVRVYDRTIEVLETAVRRAKLGLTDRQEALKSLSQAVVRIEQDFSPVAHFEEFLARERADSWKYGGRSVLGFETPEGLVRTPGKTVARAAGAKPERPTQKGPVQLGLFGQLEDKRRR